MIILTWTGTHQGTQCLIPVQMAKHTPIGTQKKKGRIFYGPCVYKSNKKSFFLLYFYSLRLLGNRHFLWTSRFLLMFCSQNTFLVSRFVTVHSSRMSDYVHIKVVPILSVLSLFHKCPKTWFKEAVTLFAHCSICVLSDSKVYTIFFLVLVGNLIHLIFWTMWLCFCLIL